MLVVMMFPAILEPRSDDLPASEFGSCKMRALPALADKLQEPVAAHSSVTCSFMLNFNTFTAEINRIAQKTSSIRTLCFTSS